ncbi:hypothetical protein ACLKMY_34430 [Paraburkholderia mimosarum]|uniref:hypothetical protein n=1 Tax=Paraburkholderia mimosarum TaxID=312026 RepID=UPI0039C369F4
MFGALRQKKSASWMQVVSRAVEFFWRPSRRSGYQADIAGIKLPVLALVALVLASGFRAILLKIAKLAINLAH